MTRAEKFLTATVGRNVLGLFLVDPSAFKSPVCNCYNLCMFERNSDNNRLSERLIEDGMLKTKKEEQGTENWTHGEGSYSHPFFSLEKTTDIRSPRIERVSAEQLIGTEKLLFDVILSRVKENRTTDPIMAMDFGGMLGLSFVRIAKALEMKGRYISEGRVVLVVTNLVLDMDKPYQDLRPYIEMDTSNRVFLNDNKHLVHYLRADAAALREQAINLPNGREVRLQGAVHVLHEHDALTHGIINDLDLPQLASVMAPRSVFFLDAKDLHPFPELGDKLNAARQKAHEVGVRDLRLNGMHALPLPESANYNVFYKGPAPYIDTKDPLIRQTTSGI